MPDTNLKLTITLEMAKDAEDLIRQVVREELALYMERTVRHRAWLPSGNSLPRFMTPRPANREETSQQ